MRIFRAAPIIGVLAICVLPAYGEYLEVTRTGTGAYSHLKASARFDALAGGQLQVVLSNISTRDVLVPADVLTAVFFNIDGNPILTPVSCARDEWVNGGFSSFWRERTECWRRVGIRPRAELLRRDERHQ